MLESRKRRHSLERVAREGAVETISGVQCHRWVSGKDGVLHFVAPGSPGPHSLLNLATLAFTPSYDSMK